MCADTLVSVWVWKLMLMQKVFLEGTLCHIYFQVNPESSGTTDWLASSLCGSISTLQALELQVSCDSHLVFMWVPGSRSLFPHTQATNT